MVLKNKSLFYTFEYILPTILLIYLAVNTTYFFLFKPYSGLDVDSSNGIITDVDVPLGAAEAIKAGDIIIRVDGKPFEDFSNNLDAPFLWDGYKPGEKIPVTVLRDGKEQEKYHVMQSPSLSFLPARLLTQWFMPYLFYAAGLLGLLFLRPRGSQRTLFVLFNFVIAVWFSASVLSGQHELGAQYVLRAAFWLWLPIAWHFHWVFPRPIKDLPVWVWTVFYVLSIFMAIAQVTQQVSPNTYVLSFLFAILGSVVLLGVHIFAQPDFRRLAWRTRALFFYLIIPVTAAAVLFFIFHKQGYYFGPLALLGISALPGFYFLILYFQNNLISGQRMNNLYRLYSWITLTGVLFGVVYAVADPFFADAGAIFANYFILILIGIMLINLTPLLILPALSNPIAQEGEDAQLQIRANRLVVRVIFIFLMLLLGSAVGIAATLALHEPLNLVATPLVAFVIGLVSLQGYAPFQRWFEQHALSIPIHPEQLLEAYSERILTSLDESTLRNLFLKEMLPSWLIRQFVLLQWDGERLHILITLGVAPAQIPQTIDAPVDWARAVLHLRLNGKTVGLMLFGRRDPDDFYAANEITVLQQIANLTALGLANIKQSAALLDLYRTDIERKETERTVLAAELHDDVLQHMAKMSIQFADLQPTPELLETYQYTAKRIREITSGLRTPLLAFGLVSALEGLVENAQDRGLEDISLTCDVKGEDIRLDERLELHLFRLAQQAFNNGLQHSKASKIYLGGTVTETAVELIISDNGVGFAAGEKLDISNLLANKHFGVAGMFERAALIGAEMFVQSQPGQGCQVIVRWAAK